MRILHVLSQHPEATGSGIYVRAMIVAAARRGHRNYLLAGVSGPDPPAIPELPPQRCRWVHFQGPDLPFAVPGMSDVMPYPSTRFGDLEPAAIAAYQAAFDRRLREAAADFRPHLIHSHHLWLVTARARRLFPDLPLVASCHGTDLRQFRQCPHLRSRVAGACRRIDAVLALSRIQRDEIAALYGIAPRRIHVAGAGYDPERFFPAPKPPPDPVRLLFAAKLSRTKGAAWLLRALARIEAPAWRLTLAGEGSGPEKEEILGLARPLGKRVEVRGLMDQAALAREMRRAHVFVLPSFFEGLPLVLLEALASGCRLVATALPGVQELFGPIADPAVWLVPLPPMAEIDTPAADGAADFVQRLAQAVGGQARAALLEPSPDLTAVGPLLARYTWDGVFNAVAGAYEGAQREVHEPDRGDVPHGQRDATQR